MIIDFENHFYTAGYVQALTKYEGYPRLSFGESEVPQLQLSPSRRQLVPNTLLDRLLDFERRIKDMDSARIDISVLTLATGCQALDPKVGVKLSREVNNELAQIIEKHPDRFRGFASVAPKSPGEAVDELDRAVRDLGLSGLQMHSNIDGEYPDSRKFWPLFEKAEQLDVPVCIHPLQHPAREFEGYGYALLGAALGYTVDAALAVLRIMVSGLLDRCPDLKIIVGHLGETLPFLATRINHASRHLDKGQISKLPSEYLSRNIYVNTCGNFHMPALRCTYDTLGGDKIVFASDYPFEDPNMGRSVQFIQDSKLPSEAKAKIFGKNGERLLKL